MNAIKDIANVTVRYYLRRKGGSPLVDLTL